eukprot:1153871-Pelagomonas_calceolata.AAC.1
MVTWLQYVSFVSKRNPEFGVRGWQGVAVGLLQCVWNEATNTADRMSGTPSSALGRFCCFWRVFGQSKHVPSILRRILIFCFEFPPLVVLEGTTNLMSMA